MFHLNIRPNYANSIMRLYIAPTELDASLLTLKDHLMIQKQQKA